MILERDLVQKVDLPLNSFVVPGNAQRNLFLFHTYSVTSENVIQNEITKCTNPSLDVFIYHL